eukprot:scaffold1402_cov254-Pinguiococcus_pyrenoidosus.AAC.28
MVGRELDSYLYYAQLGRRGKPIRRRHPERLGASPPRTAVLWEEGGSSQLPDRRGNQTASF